MEKEKKLFDVYNEYKVVYVSLIGKDASGLNIYNIFVSQNTEDVFSEGWGEKPASNIKNDILMIDNDMFDYIKEIRTDIILDLAQDNTCFSMQDARDNIVSLAYENIDEYEEYPENGRIVIHFGDMLSDVEKMLAKRDIQSKFI